MLKFIKMTRSANFRRCSVSTLLIAEAQRWVHHFMDKYIIAGSYTYVLECCLYWQRPSYCRFHQNFTRWRILSAKGEMLHWSTNSYSSLSPRSTSLHPAVLIVWGTQHGTHSFFLRGLCRDTVWTENRIIRVRIADQTNNACTYH